VYRKSRASGFPRNEKESALECALQILNDELPSPEWDQTGWQLWERLAQHCRTLLWGLRDHPLEPKAIGMMNQLGLWLKYRAEHSEAEPLLRRSLAISEKVLGPEAPDVATSLNNLALLYRAQGQYEKAAPLHERALAIWEQALGPEHPHVATSLNNLAGLYDNQGQYGKAEPLYERALAIREKALGPEHPDVATSLNNLAGLLRATNRLSEA